MLRLACAAAHSCSRALATAVAMVCNAVDGHYRVCPFCTVCPAVGGISRSRRSEGRDRSFSGRVVDASHKPQVLRRLRRIRGFTPCTDGGQEGGGSWVAARLTVIRSGPRPQHGQLLATNSQADACCLSLQLPSFRPTLCGACMRGSSVVTLRYKRGEISNE